MSKKKELRFVKMRQGIQESILKVHSSVQRLQADKEEEAGAIIVATIPKVISGEREADNMDYMIGATGNPEKIAEAMIRKAKADLNFAEFCQTLLSQLSIKMIEEGIEAKIERAAKLAKEEAKKHLKKV